MKAAKYRYSKPSGDVAKEGTAHFTENDEKRKLQLAISKQLQTSAPRSHCVLCSEALSGAKIEHRGIPYIQCGTCGHIQSKASLPEGYPKSASPSYSYENIYPQLTADEYIDRRERIYTPKLEWIVDSLKEEGWSDQRLEKASWLEIGSGAAYFISALQKQKYKNVIGLEIDDKLVAFAREHLEEDVIDHKEVELGTYLEDNGADIACAFYVLEHLEDLSGLLSALQKRPKGSVFIFSVPTWGVTTTLESIASAHYARSLDNVVHTQVYTKASIQWLLDKTDHQLAHEWIFGQDAMDALRFLELSIPEKNRTAPAIKAVLESLKTHRDELQAVFDKAHASDQTHILAIKN